MQKYKKSIWLAAIALLALVWFLFSPLLFDETVDEDFSFIPTQADFMAMPEAKRAEAEQNIMAKMAKMPAKKMDEAMPAQPVLLKSGTFTAADAAHNGEGKAQLYQLADKTKVLRLADFRVTNGPDLVVYLAKHPAPKTADDVRSQGFINLGKLKGNVGNQNYSIPEGVDISEYGSAVIWCELFGVLFSPAALDGL